MTRNFLLFAGNYYYPEGGFDDFVNAFDSLGEAEARGDLMVHEGSQADWYHVVDVEKWQKVKAGSARWE